MVMVLSHHGSLNRQHLWFQSPQRTALQFNTSCCCSHSHGNSCTLLLLLSNALVTLKLCLELITASQGPATRSNLRHLPSGPWCFWEPNDQALTLGPTHCLLLPENTLSILGITAYSHQEKETANIQTPTPKINSNQPQNTKGYSYAEVTLEVYSLALPN